MCLVVKDETGRHSYKPERLCIPGSQSHHGPCGSTCWKGKGTQGKQQQDLCPGRLLSGGFHHCCIVPLGTSASVSRDSASKNPDIFCGGSILIPSVLPLCEAALEVLFPGYLAVSICSKGLHVIVINLGEEQELTQH